MASLIEELLKAQPEGPVADPEFPHAPDGWSRKVAIRVAAEDGLTLTDEHWDLVRGLQAWTARHTNGTLQLRELHDALEERFHDRGGIKYLYRILPGGPVAQGCRLAGLTPPAGAIDKSFGSVA